MPSNFDNDKYKAIFESRYGAGSYDAGLSNARSIGASRAQVDIAKEEYNKRLQEYKEKKEKKTYQDALNYWSDPSNNSALKRNGANRTAEEIKNDPMLQMQIKEQGFTIDDYINAMYNAASNGQFRSEREFNKFSEQLQKSTNKENQARDAEYQKNYGMSYQEHYDLQKSIQESQAREGRAQKTLIIPTKRNIKKGDLSVLKKGQEKKGGDELKKKSNKKEKESNWYIDAHKWVDDKLFKPVEDKVGRFATNLADGLMLNQFKKNAKEKDNPEFLKEWTSEPTTKAEKITDFAGQMAGIAAPIGAAYKATGAIAKPIAAAAKKGGGLEKLIQAAGLSKGIHIGNPGKLIDTAVKGGAAMAGYSTVREGVDELIHPEDANFGQRASRVGLETALGVVGDPAVRALGPLIKNSSIGQKIYSMMKSKSPQPSETLALPAPKESSFVSSGPLGLPEPQLRLPGPNNASSSLDTFRNAFKQPNGLSNPIPEMPDIMRLALNRGKFEQAGVNFAQSGRYEPRPRHNLSPVETPIDPMNRGQAYWQGRYEEFANHVNQNYDMNQMTPEALEDLWSSFAKYDEPVKLEQAVDLAYPKGFEAPAPTPKTESIPELSQSTLKDALKADPRINEMVKALFPPKGPEPKISRPATLDEMVERLRELAPPKQPDPVFDPLVFKRSTGDLNRLKNLRVNDEVAAASEAIRPSFDRLRTQGYEAISPTRNEPPLIRVNENLDNTSVESIKNIEDISQFQVGTTDLYRLANKLPSELNARITNSLDNAKKSYVNLQEQLTNDLYEKVVKGLGIKKGSKESALVQDFGEKTLVKKYLKKRGIDPAKLTAEELHEINVKQLKKVHPDNWQNIIAADSYFRQNYDNLIEQVNAVRSQIYPNNPEKLVPKRTDYYHHFNELTGFEGVRNMFDTPANIDPHLEGVSPYTRPKSAFQGFMQKRGLGNYKSDAVGGFLKYLKAASHSINIDPVIPVLRKTANEIADATTDSKNANKIIETLNDYANDFAGKTNPYDRVSQKVLGRKGMAMVNWLNSRVKANMILGNLSSAIGQLGSVPLGVGKAKWSSLPAIKDSMEVTAKELGLATASKIKANQIADKLASSLKNSPVYKSQFLKERYLDVNYRQFDQRMIQQPKRLAAWMIETADKSGTRFIWNAMYQKGLKEKVQDPIKYADREARNIVAGRGVGEVPLAQKSKTVQVLAPFTLEVGNQWRVLREMVGEKDAAGILTFLIASYGLNRAIEQVRGSGVSYDPIDAMVDGYIRKDGNGIEKTGNAAASLLGETVGNIPGGNLLTQFANTNKKVPFTDMQYKELFGERDPNRFGTGLTVAKALEDPLYAILPFGAAQVRKTTQGADAIASDGVYKGDNGKIPFAGDEKELQYPIDTNPLKNLQMLLMGPTATSEAREYYNNDRRPLSEKQTQQYQFAKQQGAGDQFYQTLILQRYINNLQEKMKEVQGNQELTVEEKETELIRLMEQLQNLQK